MALAHSGADLAIILDTDMALDDVRAIVLLSQYEGVELVAGVTTDGACAPDAGAVNLRLILARLGRHRVPVAAGRILEGDAPRWRAMSESLGWSAIGEDVEGTSLAPEMTALELLLETFSHHENVVYLCLGPMSNLADLLDRDPAVAGKIGAVHYYGSPPEAPDSSWNTARDLSSAKRVFAAGLRMRSLQLHDDQLLRFDTGLADAVCALDGTAPDLLCALHSSDRVRALVDDGHFLCWDEAAVLDLLFPGLFSWRPAAGGSGLEPHVDLALGRQRYLDLLSGDLSMKHGHRHPVNLRAFPTTRDLLRPDVAAIADEALSRHGREEWNSVLLTNELHRHLGIYSILGAKMGIRARELLFAGLDELTVVSCAGTAPPLSCLTDGLQVATGATLGRGTISVHPRESRPGAIFRKGERAVDLRIKDGVVARVREDIQTCIAEHGALTPAYWAAVRALALRYWLEMVRAEIFDESWCEDGR
jgi:pyrimidine-specific ribonucleoside hydrolase